MINTLSKGVNSFNIGFFNEDIARKNMCKTKLYVVGYARLSYDEDGLGYVSIVNQREILDDVYDKEFKTADSEYVFIEDDNISGYKFDRPGLRRIAYLIEQGLCNVIIAKDLSRIGRHSALTQLFIEQCERVGVRISAMSDYDTRRESDEILLGIRAWSNERVVKDTSAKINKIIQAKQANGTWFCGAPYGYIPDFKRRDVIIDKDIEQILLWIADMYLYNDWGGTKIARTLTNEHVITCSMWERDRFLTDGREYKRLVTDKWTATVVLSILDNDFYNGVYRAGKYKRNGINGLDVRVDPSQHKVIRNHHAKIFQDDLFSAIQEKRTWKKKVAVRRKDNTESLFHGVIYCADCGNKMYIYRNNRVEPHYVCSQYFKYGKEYCTRHATKTRILEDYTLDLLQFIKDGCPDLISSINKEIKGLTRHRSAKASKVEDIEKKLDTLNSELKAIESQRIKQIIAHPEREEILNGIYDQMHADTQASIDALIKSKEQLKSSDKEGKEAVNKIKNAMSIIEDILSSKSIERRDVEALFEKISVHENGDIDIELKADLSMIGIPQKKIVDAPVKHNDVNYNFSGINEVSGGDPSLSSFITLLAIANGLDRLAKQIFVKKRV